MMGFKFAKRNIRRTPYQAIAACMVMFMTFLTMLTFFVLGFGAQRILQYFEQKPQVLAFFKDNTTLSDMKAIENALLQTGKVKSIKFVSQEDALEIYRDKNKSDPALLELVTASMLPPSFEVSTHSPQDLPPIAEMLSKEPVIGPENVAIPEDVIDNITKTAVVIRSSGVVVVAFLSVFALLILIMIIGFKIRIKRSEIEIMKLLGASNWFIRAPFLHEGIIYGVFGALSAWIAFYILLWYFTPFLQISLKDIPSEVINLPISPIFMIELLFATIVVAVIIGFLGSFGAVRRYLKI